MSVGMASEHDPRAERLEVDHRCSRVRADERADLAPAEAHLDIVHRMTPIESESLKPENYGFYNLEKQEFYTGQLMWDYLDGVAENLVGVVAHE